MFRSFIPFLLAGLGFTLIIWATKLPLFDWQISEIVTDFSSACDGALPSYWTTEFGEDLAVKNKPSFLENLNIVVKRSWSDEIFDRIALSLYNIHPFVYFGIMLSIGYIWQFNLRDKQNWFSIGMAVFLTMLAVLIFFLLTQVVRLAGPAVGQIPYYYNIWHCQGAITFSARLSKTHYGTLLVLLAGILSEIGIFVVMLYQLRIVVGERRNFFE
jgi:hypothetical protein